MMRRTLVEAEREVMKSMRGASAAKRQMLAMKVKRAMVGEGARRGQGTRKQGRPGEAWEMTDELARRAWRRRKSPDTAIVPAYEDNTGITAERKEILAASCVRLGEVAALRAGALQERKAARLSHVYK